MKAVGERSLKAGGADMRVRVVTSSLVVLAELQVVRDPSTAELLLTGVPDLR